MMEKCCKAGVNFDELGHDKVGLGHSLPCYYIAGTIPIHCDKYERKSIEEVQAEDAEMDRHMAEFMITLISKVKKEHKGKDRQGIEECPVCKGKLHMSHAKYNGHCHGQCETEGCLS